MSLDPTGFSVVLFVFLNERSFIHYLDMTLEKTELLPSSDSTWASNLLNEPHFCFTITFAEGREGIRIFDLLAVLNVYARCASSSPTVARWFHLRSEPSWQTRDLWLVSAHVLETSHRRAVPGKALQIMLDIESDTSEKTDECCIFCQIAAGDDEEAEIMKKVWTEESRMETKPSEYICRNPIYPARVCVTERDDIWSLLNFKRTFFHRRSF